MNIERIIKLIFIIAVVAVVVAFAVYRRKTREIKEIFKTAKFERRELTHIINATGATEAEGTIKVGSLINGVVKELFVEENEQVKKGQLIALLDNGKGDTDVKRTAGLVERSKAQLKYLKSFLGRQRKMYEKGHISQDEYERTESEYGQAVGALDERQAAYEKAVIDYENTKIVSPVDGVVIEKNVSLGQGVSSFLMPTVLYTIAQDLRKMKVELEVDEASIGYLEVGEDAILRFDTYPNKEFRGKIKEISNGPIMSKGTVSYKAYIYIDNSHLLLKPGMTVHADVIVDERKDILAIPGYVFSINPKLVEFVAEEKKYGYSPVTPEAIEAFKKNMKDEDNYVRTVWVLDGKTFVEKPIEIGMTDKIFFEVARGIEDDEEVVIDVEETDAMKQMFKRLFGGGMSK